MKQITYLDHLPRFYPFTFFLEARDILLQAVGKGRPSTIHHVNHNKYAYITYIHNCTLYPTYIHTYTHYINTYIETYINIRTTLPTSLTYILSLTLSAYTKVLSFSLSLSLTFFIPRPRHPPPVPPRSAFFLSLLTWSVV